LWIGINFFADAELRSMYSVVVPVHAHIAVPLAVPELFGLRSSMSRLTSAVLPFAATLAVAGFVVGVVFGGNNAAAESLVTVESKFPVKESLDRLSAELEKRGIKVAGRINHADGAKAVGMDLPPIEVMMFGNPKLGTPLMQSNPAVGIELPMKVLAWQDKAGKVWLGYQAPQAIAAKHAIKDRDEVVQALAVTLSGLVKAASGQP
jgi:uncharacterized protein (DUF302 family)